jgi:DNA-binding NarL/FixJ family response regulator
VPLPGRDGRQSGAVAVFSDVTRERTLLDSLHTSLRQNDRLVDELHAAQRRHHDLLTSLRKVDAVGEPGVLESLSARERDVVDRLALGETNREIGSALGISPGTVRKHVEHILDKLGVADRTQAAVRASELKLTIRTR